MIYIDADALSKLSHWNVLPELPGLLRCPWKDTSTIPSLRFRISSAKQKPDGRLFHSKEAAEIADSCVRQMALNPMPDPQIFAALEEVPQIDAGEALLLAFAAKDPNGFFLTGDKRSLRALAAQPISTLFVGKIICVEQVMMLFLKAKGRDWFLKNVCPHRTLDKAISMTLGTGCDATLGNLRAGLESYINELKKLRNPEILACFDD